MDIQVTNLQVGETYATEEVYFSGGLRGFPTTRGWALYPVSDDPNSDAIVFQSSEAHLRFATQECGLQFVGRCVRYQNDASSPPMDVWEPGNRDATTNLNAADSWGAVGYQANSVGDIGYANCATFLSVSLKLAGLRLRDVSRRYHDQLIWALRAGEKPGTWFSNAALLELYADFHSLVSELASARDYLSKIAAIHAGAPENIDSFARLGEWISRPVNSDHINQPMVSLILSAAGAKENPSWLRRLGEIRNEMLHTLPMGANETVSALTLQESDTSMGAIKAIRLAEPQSTMPLAAQRLDPLIELSQISTNMEHLCRMGWKLAKHPALLPNLSARPRWAE